MEIWRSKQKQSKAVSYVSAEAAFPFAKFTHSSTQPCPYHDCQVFRPHRQLACRVAQDQEGSLALQPFGANQG